MVDLLSMVASILYKAAKHLDAQGGELPVVSVDALREADFITLPENVPGTNCSVCEYSKGGVCQHPKLKGQPVNARGCCAYWDNPKALRTWKGKSDG